MMNPYPKSQESVCICGHPSENHEWSNREYPAYASCNVCECRYWQRLMVGGHTPGPWHVENRVHVYANGDEHRIASATLRDDETEISNARLIAAAPELLEACRKLCDALAFGGVTEEFEDLYNDACMLIAKAEGGTP